MQGDIKVEILWLPAREPALASLFDGHFHSRFPLSCTNPIVSKGRKLIVSI